MLLHCNLDFVVGLVVVEHQRTHPDTKIDDDKHHEVVAADIRFLRPEHVTNGENDEPCESRDESADVCVRLHA